MSQNILPLDSRRVNHVYIDIYKLNDVMQELFRDSSCLLLLHCNRVMSVGTDVGLDQPDCCYLQHLVGISYVPPICLILECQKKTILGIGFQLKANPNDDPEYLDLNKEALNMLIKALTS